MSASEHGDDLTIAIPITSAFRQAAEDLATEQSDKADQVRCRALAVLAVEEYLQWQGFALSREQSLFWDGTTRLVSPVADVVLSNLGRLECLIADEERDCPVAAETWRGRIGYMAVTIEETQVRLLGFMRPFALDDPLTVVEADELESLDELMLYLERLGLARDALAGGRVAEPGPLREVTEPLEKLAVVAQLERLFAQERPNRWRVKGEKVLSARGVDPAGVRESFEETRETGPVEDLLALQDAAEQLMQGLAEVWDTTETGGLG